MDGAYNEETLQNVKLTFTLNNLKTNIVLQILQV